MSTTQAPEPTSYVVEGDSYRKLIAERDAYKRIANDLARQLRERTPADTNAPPERATQETPAVHPFFRQEPAVPGQLTDADRLRPEHTAAHDCACADCVKDERPRSAPRR